MTTVIDKPTSCTVIGYRRCEGCPRCQDPDAGFCKASHPEVWAAGWRYKDHHPVCRKCRHCVLRGSHADDISDLEV